MYICFINKKYLHFSEIIFIYTNCLNNFTLYFKINLLCSLLWQEITDWVT